MRRPLYIALLAFGGVQCQKQEEPLTALLPADFKAMVRFDVGTYWVYQDSATQVLDSVWVTHLDERIYPSKDGNDIIGYNEGVDVQIQHNRGGHLVHYGTSARCLAIDTKPEGCARLIRRRIVAPDPTGGDVGRQSIVLEYPLPVAQPVILNAGIYLYRYATPLSISAHTYADVVRVYHPSDDSEGGAAVTYYWAPNHGLVQRRIRPLNRPAQTWTLIREHIVQ